VNDKELYYNLEQSTATLHTTMLQAQTGVTDFQENMEALKHNFLLSGYFKKRGYEDEADLGANRIGGLPGAAPLKTFTFKAEQLFDKRDSAKLKHEKSLNEAGKFLADNEFGVAVVEVSAGMEGDAQEDLKLTEARAMVVRQYLVGNFGFDDTSLKTLGEGKQAVANADAGWGSVKIVIYPVGTQMPSAATTGPVNSSSTTPAGQPAQASAPATNKQ
jgi:outer membrane protein OmpA-like peptidoglycan-associated protein